jgi:hypothetical protein
VRETKDQTPLARKIRHLNSLYELRELIKKHELNPLLKGNTEYSRQQTLAIYCEFTQTKALSGLINGHKKFNDSLLLKIGKFYCFDNYNLTDSDIVSLLSDGTSMPLFHTKLATIKYGKLKEFHTHNANGTPYIPPHIISGHIASINAPPLEISVAPYDSVRGPGGFLSDKDEKLEQGISKIESGSLVLCKFEFGGSRSGYLTLLMLFNHQHGESAASLVIPSPATHALLISSGARVPKDKPFTLGAGLGLCTLAACVTQNPLQLDYLTAESGAFPALDRVMVDGLFEKISAVAKQFPTTTFCGELTFRVV